jgi:hypothetical protein
MSKHAYEKGVVLIKCDGCKNLHLMADHLGWFDTTQKKPGTIEDIMKAKGETVQRLRFEPKNVKFGNTEQELKLQKAFEMATPEDLKEIEDGLLEYLPRIEQDLLTK